MDVKSKKIDYSVFNMESLAPEAMDKQFSTNMDSAINLVNPLHEDILTLQRAATYWNGLRGARDRRARNRRYYRGDQWGDKVYDPDTEKWVTEEELIKSHGKVPLKQNQIRQLIKNLIGQYLTDTTRPAVVSHRRGDAAVADMLTNTIQYGLQINRAQELDTRNFEEFLISGTAMWKSTFTFSDKLQKDELYIEKMPIPNAFWTPDIKDIRQHDMDFIGCFYDMYMNDLLASFAKSPEDEIRLKQMYAHVLKPEVASGFGGNSLTSFYTDNADFYIPIQPDKARVFEIWQRQSGWRLKCHDWLNGEYFVATMKDKQIIDTENMIRLADAAAQGQDPKLTPLITYTGSIQRFWTVKYLNWLGYVLYEAETPYEHKEHPFTLLLYPLVDGEVWGFVEDVIDQQRYINRLVTLLDFIIGSSAKGVLLVPEDSIADDFDIDQIASEWTKFNGVIKIKLKPGASVPQQITANSTNIGINELLNLQLKFMSDISGVSGPIQGQSSTSGTPAALYAQETQNSTLNSKDYFAAFNAAKAERDWKALKVQIQYYDDDRNLALSGASYNAESLIFKKERAKNVQFDMSMAKTPDSPVYRNLIEQPLRDFLAANLIDFKMYLKNSSLPFADNLLNDIITQEKTMAEQVAAGAPTPVGAQAVPGGSAVLGTIGQSLQGMGADASKADPKAMAMLGKYVSGLDNIN